MNITLKPQMIFEVSTTKKNIPLQCVAIENTEAITFYEFKLTTHTDTFQLQKLKVEIHINYTCPPFHLSRTNET